MRCETIPCEIRGPGRSSIPSRLLTQGSFLALLAQLCDLGENQADLISHSERPWASATFAGSRHHFTLEFRGSSPIAAGEALIAALPDHEFNIPGQLVADAAVAGVHSCQSDDQTLVIDIEILLLEEV